MSVTAPSSYHSSLCDILNRQIISDKVQNKKTIFEVVRTFFSQFLQNARRSRAWVGASAWVRGRVRVGVRLGRRPLAVLMEGKT